MGLAHKSTDKLAVFVFGSVTVVALATMLLSTQCQSEEAAETTKAAGAVAPVVTMSVAASLDKFEFVAPRAKPHLILELPQSVQNLQRSDSALDDDTQSEATIPRLPPSNPAGARPAPPQAASLVEALPWRSESSTTRIQKLTPALARRLEQITPSASQRLSEKFAAAKAAWPPAEMALLAIKDEKALELYTRAPGGTWHFVHRYPVLAASGGPGPKLVRGDKQVPEGVYAISFLNPHSRYHVSMRVNYPNAFDRQMAKKDGRKDLGGDIMIHGKKSSSGCLAVGDEAAEELFVLASMTGLANVKLIIAPSDFRSKGVPVVADGQPSWLPALYAEVASAMSPFDKPQPPSFLSFFMN